MSIITYIGIIHNLHYIRGTASGLLYLRTEQHRKISGTEMHITHNMAHVEFNQKHLHVGA